MSSEQGVARSNRAECTIFIGTLCEFLVYTEAFIVMKDVILGTFGNDFVNIIRLDKNIIDYIHYL